MYLEILSIFTRQKVSVKKILRVAGLLMLSLIVITAGIVAYIKIALPNVGKAPEMKIALTPDRIAHGAYLAKHVAGCIGCHSSHNWSFYDGPVFDSTYAAGGERFDQDMGYPGVFYSRNITPYSLGRWTDGEIFRAITCGVSKNGSALSDAMPYTVFGALDSDDIVSVIAYLRTIKAIKKDIPASQIDFPANITINTLPRKAAFTYKPDTTNHVAYGKYLVTMAGCASCHTPIKNGKPIPNMDFSGNQQFPFTKYVVSSANITPDEETGIGSWTKTAFINRFKSFSDTSYHLQKVTPDDPNTLMPWLEYTGLTTADLGDIYEYLRTVPPVKSVVVKFQKK